MLFTGLVRTLIDSKDSAGAKAALSENARLQRETAPLFSRYGPDHAGWKVKKDEARQQFETAINLTKGKDVDRVECIAWQT
jgi:hypothetical protein